jgi:hypothetical protein
MSDVANIQGIWWRFLVEAMFAENYELGYLDEPLGGNPVVDKLLPALLQIKAVGILDLALRSWCDGKGLVIPKTTYGTDLKGRIDYLVENRHLSDGSFLHSIRDTRNILAHEPMGEINWQQLESHVMAIHGSLRELGLVGDFPKWQINVERSPAHDPNGPDATFPVKRRIRITDGVRIVGSISWL